MIGWFRRQWVRSDWLLYVLTAVVIAVLTVTALELWDARITVPLTYWGDALATADHFKTTMETGWFTYQPLLGAPYGQTYNDFPTAENLNFMAAGLLGFLTHNYVIALNVYYFLGFVAEALTALWLFRKLKLTRAVSLILAVLFALAPYHFIRGESHLFLASYYLVPLSVWLVIAVLRGQPIWSRPLKGSPWYRWITSPFVGTLLILLLTATAETYYCVFFFILLAFAALVRLIHSHEWRRFWGAAIAGAVTLAATLLNSLPNLVYSWLNGQNAEALGRGHADAEIYALKLSQLILPWSGSRIPILARIRGIYDATYPLPSELPALGTAAAIGLVALFLSLAYVVATGARARALKAHVEERFSLFNQLGSLVFVAFLFATIGGLSTIISFVTPNLRGWNRIAIYMSILCLAAFGILLDALIRWVQRKARAKVVGQRLIAAGIALVVLVAGYIDQTPANPGSGYAATISSFDADTVWINRIDKVMQPGAEVLQLPYLPFPEASSPNGVLSSDALIPFLHSTDIHWSAGGIKGRPRADWPDSIAQYSPAQIALLAATANFSGIYIDRKAMTRAESRTLEAGLTSYLGTKPLVSADKRYSFFNLRPEVAKVRAETTSAVRKPVEVAVVNPVEVSATTGFSVTQASAGDLVALSGGPSGPLGFTNARGKSISATLTMTVKLVSPAKSETTVTLTLPDGSTHEYATHDGSATISVKMRVPAGSTTGSVAVTDAKGSTPTTFSLRHVRLTEHALSTFLATYGPTAP